MLANSPPGLTLALALSPKELQLTIDVKNARIAHLEESTIALRSRDEASDHLIRTVDSMRERPQIPRSDVADFLRQTGRVIERKVPEAVGKTVSYVLRSLAAAVYGDPLPDHMRRAFCAPTATGPAGGPGSSVSASASPAANDVESTVSNSGRTAKRPRDESRNPSWELQLKTKECVAGRYRPPLRGRIDLSEGGTTAQAVLTLGAGPGAGTAAAPLPPGAEEDVCYLLGEKHHVQACLASFAVTRHSQVIRCTRGTAAVKLALTQHDLKARATYALVEIAPAGNLPYRLYDLVLRHEGAASWLETHLPAGQEEAFRKLTLGRRLPAAKSIDVWAAAVGREPVKRVPGLTAVNTSRRAFVEATRGVANLASMGPTVPVAPVQGESKEEAKTPVPRK